MIMSQCRSVNNWNFKTKIISPVATFASPAATFSSLAAERYRKCLLILCCTRMRTKHTCASYLCLSGDKMAAVTGTKLKTGTDFLKATVWQHFEFREVEGRIDKTYTVCKVCGTQLK